LSLGSFFVEVSRPHTVRQAHHTRYDSSEPVICPSQRPVPAQNTTKLRDEHSLPSVALELATPKIKWLLTYAFDVTPPGSARKLVRVRLNSNFSKV
jgi:hypothetical protein